MKEYCSGAASIEAEVGESDVIVRIEDVCAGKVFRTTVPLASGDTEAQCERELHRSLYVALYRCSLAGGLLLDLDEEGVPLLREQDGSIIPRPAPAGWESV